MSGVYVQALMPVKGGSGEGGGLQRGHGWYTLWTTGEENHGG